MLLTSGYNDPDLHSDNKSMAPNIVVLNKPYLIELFSQRMGETIEPSIG